jgi:hypothetical protein
MSLYETLASVIPTSLHLPHYLLSYESGTTPLSTVKEVAIAMATYFLIIFSGRELMRYVQTLFLPPFSFGFGARAVGRFGEEGRPGLLRLMGMVGGMIGRPEVGVQTPLGQEKDATKQLSPFASSKKARGGQRVLPSLSPSPFSPCSLLRTDSFVWFHGDVATRARSRCRPCSRLIISCSRSGPPCCSL